jgi:hypothetical protein
MNLKTIYQNTKCYQASDVYYHITYFEKEKVSAFLINQFKYCRSFNFQY